MSVTEYGKWRPPKPPLATQHDRANTILSPRFCISQQHGNQEPKYRAIGDMAQSQVNITVGASDTYCPQDLDMFMALARLQQKCGATNLRMWPLYFPNAYKTIGLNEASWEAAHICFTNPANNRPYMARVLVQPFGSRRSPANWGGLLRPYNLWPAEYCRSRLARLSKTYCASRRAAWKCAVFGRPYSSAK